MQARLTCADLSINVLRPASLRTSRFTNSPCLHVRRLATTHQLVILRALLVTLTT